ERILEKSRRTTSPALYNEAGTSRTADEQRPHSLVATSNQSSAPISTEFPPPTACRGSPRSHALALLHRPRRRPFAAALDQLLQGRVFEGLAVMTKGLVEDPALAILDCEGQRLGFVTEVGIGLHQHVDGRIALELGVEFIVGLEVLQALGDRVVLLDNPRLEDAARAVARRAHDPATSAE